MSRAVPKVELDGLWKAIVEGAPDGVVILAAGSIVYSNPTATRLLGADPAAVVGTQIGQYLPARDAQDAMKRVGEMFRSGKDMPPNEYGVLADPGRTVEIKSIVVEWEGRPAVLAFARDVTERKAIEQKLMAADRFAALGKVAAGVAHEINNPLVYVQLGLELVERRITKLALAEADALELRGHLEQAQHGLKRIAAVTGDLRTFIRADDSPPGPTDLVSVIEQSLRMVDNDLRHRARLERHFVDIPPVIANASRLEQVFVNLLINAIQSLRDPVSDAITVMIGAVDEAVIVSIADTGHGIPADVRDRVFDPFFTTKPIGEGMGLGLSVCKNIVESFGGQLTLASGAAGTTATVTLRAFTPTLGSPPLPVPVAYSTRRRRVLIIDDEPFVRETLAVLLSPHHEITTAESGGEALAHLGNHVVDVVLCDVMMPSMDGMEVHRRIAAAHAGLEHHLIFMTGGVFTSALESFLAVAGNRCFGKPFKIDQLLAAIAVA